MNQRKLTPKEMADLPSKGWSNVKVDERYYIPTFTKAYEVDKEAYKKAFEFGCMCIIFNEKFIVTNA